MALIERTTLKFIHRVFFRAPVVLSLLASLFAESTFPGNAAECPPDKDVCVSAVIGPDNANASENSLLNLSIREMAKIATDAAEWGFNHLLTLFIIIPILFVIVALLWRLRRRFSRASRRDDYYGGRRLAVLQKIGREAGELQKAVVKIQDILGQHTSRGVSSQDVVGNKNYRDFIRATDQPASESEAQIILNKIISQLFQVSSRLDVVKKDAQFVQTSSRTVEIAEQEAERLRNQSKKLMALLSEKENELNRIVQENSKLRRESESMRAHSDKARERYFEAEQLLIAYQNGLPSFISSSELGSHFSSFSDLLQKSQASYPNYVTRLNMMLRVLAEANGRDDSGFELIWSVHETGKALYGLMRAMGADQAWQFEESTAWALALNKFGAGRYTVIVPAIRSAFNGLEMTGGNPQSLITDVRCWGVKNRRGDVERKAIVS